MGGKKKEKADVGGKIQEETPVCIEKLEKKDSRVVNPCKELKKKQRIMEKSWGGGGDDGLRGGKENVCGEGVGLISLGKGDKGTTYLNNKANRSNGRL